MKTKTVEVDIQLLKKIIEYIENLELGMFNEHEGYSTIEELLEDNKMPEIYIKLKQIIE
jgi:hypothetical protein